MEFNVRELADAAGLKSYDTALPLQWYDDVHDKTGFWPQSYGFVWCYDKPAVWGEPYPLTDAAKILLKFYEKMLMLSHYCEKHDDCDQPMTELFESRCEFNPESVRNIVGLERK